MIARHGELSRRRKHVFNLTLIVGLVDRPKQLPVIKRLALLLQKLHLVMLAMLKFHLHLHVVVILPLPYSVSIRAYLLILIPVVQRTPRRQCLLG